MARKRMVDPAMFTSENVAALPVATRYTWVGLLCYLDDTGRGKDNAALVKASVWPLDGTYTAKKVAGDLVRLAERGMLCRYECCGTKQFHAPTWDTWQRISHPTPTKLCPCPGHEGFASREHLNDSGVAPEGFPKSSGATPRNVVEVSSGESSSSGPCRHGAEKPGLCGLCRRAVMAS